MASEDGGATGVQLGDWLGTSRAFWSYTGGGFGQSGAHAPFGESYALSSGYAKDFTGQQTFDGVTYAFPERYYHSTQGRWLSPDPAGGGAANVASPQSWNRYAYVLNNPLIATDPSGLDCVYTEGDAPSNGNGFYTDNGYYLQIGDCASSTDNGYYFDGSVNVSTISMDDNGNVWAAVGLDAVYGCSGDSGCDANNGPDGSVADTFSPVPLDLASSVPGNLIGQCPAQPLAGNPPITTQFGAVDASHSQPHLGRDYGVPVGTPVFAPYGGSIGFAGSAGTFGNVVVITNPEWNVYLAHLSSILVATGNQVSAGDRVGLSGNTGHSTGPHLHFEQHTAGPIWQNGHAPRATAVEPCH